LLLIGGVCRIITEGLLTYFLLLAVHKKCLHYRGGSLRITRLHEIYFYPIFTQFRRSFDSELGPNYR